MLGEWANEDYSVACMYADDYRAVGGYNLSAINFHFDLYQRHIASGLQVNRSDLCVLDGASVSIWFKLVTVAIHK